MKEAIVVEGKYDKIKLSSLVEGVIIEVGGSACSRTGKSWSTCGLAKARGLIVLTDSDAPGSSFAASCPPASLPSS